MAVIELAGQISFPIGVGKVAERPMPPISAFSVTTLLERMK
jgi:hypothetical protein